MNKTFSKKPNACGAARGGACDVPAQAGLQRHALERCEVPQRGRELALPLRGAGIFLLQVTPELEFYPDVAQYPNLRMGDIETGIDPAGSSGSSRAGAPTRNRNAPDASSVRLRRLCLDWARKDSSQQRLVQPRGVFLRRGLFKTARSSSSTSKDAAVHEAHAGTTSTFRYGNGVRNEREDNDVQTIQRKVRMPVPVSALTEPKIEVVKMPGHTVLYDVNSMAAVEVDDRRLKNRAGNEASTRAAQLRQEAAVPVFPSAE